jgi:hypothetical protein
MVFILQNRPYLSRKLQLVRPRCLLALGVELVLAGPSSTYQQNMSSPYTDKYRGLPTSTAIGLMLHSQWRDARRSAAFHHRKNKIDCVFMQIVRSCRVEGSM